MDLRTVARAALAPLFVGAVLLGAAGCAVAHRADDMRLVTPEKVPGTNPTVTQTSGGAYLSWDMPPASAGLPRMALARIDPRTGQIGATNTFSRGILGAPLFAGGSLWVTDSAPLGELLLRLNPATLMVTGELSLSAARYPDGSHLAYAGGWLWADGGGSLLRISASSVEVTATVALRGAYRSNVAASADGSALVVTEQAKTGPVRQYCADTGTGRIGSVLTPDGCG